MRTKIIKSTNISEFSSQLIEVKSNIQKYLRCFIKLVQKKHPSVLQILFANTIANSAAMTCSRYRNREKKNNNSVINAKSHRIVFCNIKHKKIHIFVLIIIK